MRKIFWLISVFFLLSNGVFATTIFEEYPWLTNVVQQDDCSTEKIEVYQTSIFTYLLVTDAEGTAVLYNQAGQFYCQSASNFNCVALYNLEGPIDSWDCAANLESTCLIKIINNQCKVIGVYDENDNLLTTMNNGPLPIGPPGQTAPIWEDPRPLEVEENRVYIFKENNFVLGRQTVSCANTKIEVTSNYYSGCTDAVGIVQLINTGCRTISLHDTQSKVLRTHEPGDTFYVTTGPFISLLIADADTLAIISDNDRNGEINSGGCAEETGNTCSIKITNTQCRQVGVYDEEGNFLTQMMNGPYPNMPIELQIPSVWVDPKPLGEAETRTYIFKENNLVLGRQTVSCANTEINVVSEYFSGCTDALGIAEVTNTGCRVIELHNTKSEIKSTHNPGETFYFSTGNAINILIAGEDTLGINGNAFGKYSVNSGGCEEEGNQPVSNIPENFEDYYVIYTLCKGDTLRVPNPIRTIQCPTPLPPPGGGIVENFPFLRAPEWRSNTGDNFYASFRLGYSELTLFPTETTIYEGSYPTFSCGGAAGPLGLPIKYLVLVEDTENCTSEGQPNFVIEACVGDIIELPSPDQIGQTERSLCAEKTQLAGGSVVELVELDATVMKVRIKEAGKFSVNGFGGSVQTIYNRATIEHVCPLTSYQFEIKLKEDCGETGGGNVALFDDYPWLNNLINSNDCTTESIELYQTSIFFYLLVKDATGKEALYNADGQFYCQHSPNFDCVAAYNLGSPIDSWSCGDIPPPPPPPTECGANTGIFFFRACDDGQIFYFIELEDGTIYDPYFAEGLSFDVLDGQVVQFDYVDANFATPCSIAEKAITITCVEALDFPTNDGDCRKNRGEIVVLPCDDGTDFFFIKSATDGLLYDTYFAEGIDFVKYDRQQVNFDYELAGFDSPCSVADGAIIVTCIEETVTELIEYPPVFVLFDWLEDLVDPINCEGQTETLIAVYQQSIFNFIMVQKDGIRQLYFEDGTFYCQDSYNFDCVAAYNLGNPVDMWSCSGAGLSELTERTNGIEQNNLKLFPNPVSTNLTVQLPTTIQEKQQLRIFDTFGRIVLEKTVTSSTNTLEVDVTSYQNGLYYLVLFGNGKETVQKFVKQDLE